MIGYFKNRDRVTLLNQSFWHTRQRSFRRGEICQLIHRPRLGCRPRGLHFSWTQGTGTQGGIIPLATTLLGGARWRSTSRLYNEPAGSISTVPPLIYFILYKLYAAMITYNKYVISKRSQCFSDSCSSNRPTGGPYTKQTLGRTTGARQCR